MHAMLAGNGLRASLIKYSGLSEEAEPEKRLMEFVVLYYEQMQRADDCPANYPWKMKRAKAK